MNYFFAPCQRLLLATLLAALAGLVLPGCHKNNATASPPPAPPVLETKAPPAATARKLPDRMPAVAGQFYPGDTEELREVVKKYLDVKIEAAGRARLVVAPHAGYVYSGPVAGYSFAALDPSLTRIIVLAANHSNEANYRGISVPLVSTYVMPGNDVPVDTAAVEQLLRRPQFVNVPAAHTMHMIEVELPFLSKRLKERYKIIPMVSGYLGIGDVETIADLLVEYLADPHTGIVFSMDMSHYHPYEEAKKLDGACLQSLLQGNTSEVAGCENCGHLNMLIALRAGQKMGWAPALLKAANSGDTTGDKGRVVGYAAVAWLPKAGSGFQSAPLRQNKAAQEALLGVARQAIEAMTARRQLYEPPPELSQKFPFLAEPGSVFVTLSKNGELRGCIGSLTPRQALLDDVRDNAVSAAVRDSRFPPVQAEELKDIFIEVSVLDLPKPLPLQNNAEAATKLRPGVDGVILSVGVHRSTFLPDVWKQIPEPKEFLSKLCRKQGSPADCWSDPAARYETYETFIFAEPGFHLD